MRKRRIFIRHSAQENMNWKENYDELLKKHLELQKELMETTTEYNNKYSDHMNTLHFLQNKIKALNTMISQKNKQISGLLSLKTPHSPPLSEDEDDANPPSKSPG